MGYRKESVEFHFSYCDVKITSIHFANHANIIFGGSKLQKKFYGLPCGKCWVSRPLLSHLQVAPDMRVADSGPFSREILVTRFFFRRNSDGGGKSSFPGENIFWPSQTILQNTYWAGNWRNNFSSSSFLLVNSVFLSFRLHVQVVDTKDKRSFLQFTFVDWKMWNNVTLIFLGML